MCKFAVKDTVIAYTDGSCDNSKKRNPEGFGGIGVVLLWNGFSKEVSEGFKNATNNTMELMGIIYVLETITPGYRIRIVSDSRYCIDSINKGWVFTWDQFNELRYRKNGDLWERFLKAYNRHDSENLTFNWVRGHVGHEFNEKADQLAKEGFRSRSNREISKENYESH